MKVSDNILRKLARDYDDVGERILQLAAVAAERQPRADAYDLLEQVQSAVEVRALPKSRRITIAYLLFLTIGTTGLLWYINARRGLAYSAYIEEHENDLDVNRKQPTDTPKATDKPQSDNKEIYVAPIPDSPSYQLDSNANINDKVTDIGERMKLLERKWLASVEYSNFNNQLLIVYVFVLPSAILWIGILLIRLKWPSEHAGLVVANESIEQPLRELELLAVRSSKRLRIAYRVQLLFSIVILVAVAGVVAWAVFELAMDHLRSAAAFGCSGGLGAALAIKWQPFKEVRRVGMSTEAADVLATGLRMRMKTIGKIEDTAQRQEAEWQAVREYLDEAFQADVNDRPQRPASRNSPGTDSPGASGILASQSQPRRSHHKHRILFLAANPNHSSQLALEREVRAIHVELERSGCREQFEFITRWAIQPQDLLRELRKLRPTVVHFSGHGQRSCDLPPAIAPRHTDDRVGRPNQAVASGLYFQAADGSAQFVSAAAIQQTFGSAGSSVRIVVLNACYSAAQAEALLAHVDCVLGTSCAIQDDASRHFAIGFYGGLGEREPVALAYEQGRAAIILEGLGDADLPQLRVRAGVDAGRLVLASAHLTSAGGDRAT
jgi:hypothetical protein